MKFTPEQKKQWSDLYEHGDFEAIAAESGISSTTIRLSFNDGRATEQVIDAIHNFYLARKQKNDLRIAQMNGTITNNQEAA